MTPEQERELTLLMAASQQGDRLAYEALLESLGRVVSLYVRRRVGAADFVEDIVQDVLLSIHRARHTWNPARPFAPWFYAVTHNRMLDAVRRHRRSIAREVSVDVVPPVVWSFVPETEAVSAADLSQALRQLTPAQRVVVEKLKLQEMSVKDVARETGMSESNVKVTAHRGYAALRRFLTGIGYGD
jgi:RNA polymerase sigma-70 factor (ECF subfamily)